MQGQNDFVKTVNFRVFLVLLTLRYDFYHKLTIFALNFTGNIRMCCLSRLKRY